MRLFALDWIGLMILIWRVLFKIIQVCPGNHEGKGKKVLLYLVFVFV